MLKLHGHPQLAQYDDPSQYGDYSCQSNWVHGENPRSAPVSDPILDLPGGTFGNGKLGHTHNDVLRYPAYAEISAPFPCRFAVKLFQVTGQAFVNPAFQDGIRDLVWDTTGTSTSPDLIGDPNDEVIFTGSMVVDPSIAVSFPTKHGWWNPSWTITTRYANGDVVDQQFFAPALFVTIDTSLPETNGVPFTSARVAPHSTLHPEENFGDNQVETLRNTVQYLPVAPLTAPFTVRFATAGYGADDLPPAITEIRADADIHRFIPGRVLFEIEQTKNHQFDYTFDPAILGPGTHSIIVGRRQVTLSNDELIVTQLVFKIVVPGVPPQTVTVPNVTGLMHEDALNALDTVGLIASVDYEYSSTVPVGIVYAQDPAAGTEVQPHSIVLLTESLGPLPSDEVWTPTTLVAEKSSKGRTRIILG